MRTKTLVTLALLLASGAAFGQKLEPTYKCQRTFGSCEVTSAAGEDSNYVLGGNRDDSSFKHAYLEGHRTKITLFAEGGQGWQQYETGDTVTYTYQFDIGPVHEERVTLGWHDAIHGNDEITGEAAKECPCAMANADSLTFAKAGRESTIPLDGAQAAVDDFLRIKGTSYAAYCRTAGAE